MGKKVECELLNKVEIASGIFKFTVRAPEIAELAKFRQILVITHQAIIAAKADRHFLVTKEQGDFTTVEIKTLNDEEKILAIAKLAAIPETTSAPPRPL